MDYKREMVLLFVPFNNENDVNCNYLQIYSNNENIIMQRRKEYENNLNIEKTVQALKNLMAEDDNNNDELVHDVQYEDDPYQLYGRQNYGRS